MKYLFSYLDRLRQVFINSYILLFLDYDGTLTPIVESPDKAIISSRAKELLKRLSKLSRCKIAIISGRALKDIKKMVDIKGIIYAGNHGLEIQGPKIKFENPVSSAWKKIIRQLRNDLNKKLSSVKGAFVEDKVFTLSIHYRLVKEKNIPLIKNVLDQAIKPYIVGKKIRLNFGKKVFELKPPVEWNKGKVVLWLLARQRHILGKNKILPVYLGDDTTDEDAFKALKNKGITIFVGKPRASQAQYYLKNNREATRFIKHILEIKKATTLPYAESNKSQTAI